MGSGDRAVELLVNPAISMRAAVVIALSAMAGWRFWNAGTRNCRSGTLAASRAASSKVSARGRISREEREYLGDPGYVLNTGPRRKDTLLTPEIAFDYRPWRNAGMALSYQAPERRSNLSLTGYESRIVSLSAFAEF